MVAGELKALRRNLRDPRLAPALPPRSTLATDLPAMTSGKPAGAFSRCHVASRSFKALYESPEAMVSYTRSFRAPAPPGDLLASRCNAQSHAGEHYLARSPPLG
jgi:hypothetical protein